MEHASTTEPPHCLSVHMCTTFDREIVGAPTLPLYDSVHMCTTFDREIVGVGSKTTRPRQLP